MGRSSAASGWGSAEAYSILIHLFQIDDLRLRSQVFQQFRGAGVVREAGHLGVGVLQVAEHNRSGGATRPTIYAATNFYIDPYPICSLRKYEYEPVNAKRAL